MGYKAVDIADYIISHCVDTTPISNLQLNKILYFVQRFFLQNTPNPEGLFDDDFQAWQLGPVLPEVYYKYCGFGGMYILLKPQKVITLPINIRLAVDEIVDKNSGRDPWDLVNETHDPKGAWAYVYKNGIGIHNIIEKSLIRTLG